MASAPSSLGDVQPRISPGDNGLHWGRIILYCSLRFSLTDCKNKTSLQIDDLKKGTEKCKYCENIYCLRAWNFCIFWQNAFVNWIKFDNFSMTKHDNYCLLKYDLAVVEEERDKT